MEGRKPAARQVPDGQPGTLEIEQDPAFLVGPWIGTVDPGDSLGSLEDRFSLPDAAAPEVPDLVGPLFPVESGFRFQEQGACRIFQEYFDLGS